MIDTACPRCESQQKFARHVRDTPQEWQEVYYRCSMCRYEQVIGVTNPEIEELKRKSDKALARYDHEAATFGQASRSTAAMYGRIRHRLVEAIKKVERQVELWNNH